MLLLNKKIENIILISILITILITTINNMYVIKKENFEHTKINEIEDDYDYKSELKDNINEPIKITIVNEYLLKREETLNNPTIEEIINTILKMIIKYISKDDNSKLYIDISGNKNIINNKDIIKNVLKETYSDKNIYEKILLRFTNLEHITVPTIPYNSI